MSTSPSKVANFTIPLDAFELIRWLASRTSLSQSEIVRLVLVPGLLKLRDLVVNEGASGVAKSQIEFAQATCIYMSSHHAVTAANDPGNASPIPPWIAALSAPTPASPPPSVAKSFINDPDCPAYVDQHAMEPIRNGSGVWFRMPAACKAHGVTVVQLEAMLDPADDMREAGGHTYIDKTGMDRLAELAPNPAPNLLAWVAYKLLKTR